MPFQPAGHIGRPVLGMPFPAGPMEEPGRRVFRRAITDMTDSWVWELS